MCHAIVMVFMLGFTGPQDLQFVDSCPIRRPAACWVRWATNMGADDNGVVNYAVCVDNDKRTVYKGRVSEMIES